MGPSVRMVHGVDGVVRVIVDIRRSRRYVGGRVGRQLTVNDWRGRRRR